MIDFYKINVKITYFSLFAIAILFAISTLYEAIHNFYWCHNIREAIVKMNEGLSFPSIQVGNVPPKLKNAASKSTLDTALLYLMQGKKWNPNSKPTYYLIGLVHAAQGDWQHAVESFANMYSIFPNPQLPGWVSVLTEEWLGKHFLKLEPFYKAHGFNSLQLELLQSADIALLRRQFKAASQIYESVIKDIQSNERLTIPDDLLFRSTYAAALSAGKDIEELSKLLENNKNDSFLSMDANTSYIEGGQFRWMTPINPPTVTFGTKLNFPYNGKIGTMWWAGQAASLFFISEDARYEILFKLLHNGTAPIELLIGVDGAMIQNVTLIDDNRTMGEARFESVLCEGFHSINVWFLNNDGFNGIEKDAFIESVTVRRQVRNAYGSDCLK
jgi:tetratricopeptide (TPR) repeat protein